MPMTFSSLKILILSAAIIAAVVVKADAQAQMGKPTLVLHQTDAATPPSSRRVDVHLLKRHSTPIGHVLPQKRRHLVPKSPKAAGHSRLRG